MTHQDLENERRNTDLWVDARMASLQGMPDWNPDAGKALARMRDRERAYRGRWREWAWAAAAASIVAFSVLAMPGRCETPGAHFCGQPLASRLMNQVLAAAVTVRQPPVFAPFKQIGSPAAPITLEIYTDYECPACALLYRDTMPRLMADYVATGKIKLIHRDFPLQQHAYARLAARYANAAGRLGQYEVAVDRLFETQNQWSADGSVDRQLAQVCRRVSCSRCVGKWNMMPRSMIPSSVTCPWPPKTPFIRRPRR